MIILNKYNYSLGNETNFDLIPFDFQTMTNLMTDYNTQKTISMVLSLLDYKIDGFNKLSESNITLTERLYFQNCFDINILDNLKYTLMKSNMRFILIDDKDILPYPFFSRLDFTLKSNLDKDKVNNMTTYLISSNIKNKDETIYNLLINILDCIMDKYLLNIGVNLNRRIETSGITSDNKIYTLAECQGVILNSPNFSINDAVFILFYIVSIYKGLDKSLNLKFKDFDNIPLSCIYDLWNNNPELDKLIYGYAISENTTQDDMIQIINFIYNCNMYKNELHDKLLDLIETLGMDNP